MMNYTLKNGLIVSYPDIRPADVGIQGEEITFESGSAEHELDCSGCIIYPGLINLHEHFRINVMGKFGTPPYQSSSQWVEEHQSCEKYRKMRAIEDQLSVHYWGALKNIFSGVTTVLDFGPPDLEFSEAELRDFPLDVYHRRNLLLFIWTDYARRIIADSKERDLVLTLHIGEGLLESNALELSQLIQAGGLWDRTLLVHGIALDESDLKTVKNAGARLAWCPSSNKFLIGKTLMLDKAMDMDFPLILATDSNNSGLKNIFEELSFARQLARSDFNIELSGLEALRMVTVNPAEFIKKGDSLGLIRQGYKADLFIYERDPSVAPEEQIFELGFSGVRAVFSKGMLMFARKDFLAWKPDPSLYSEFEHEGVEYVLKGRDYNGLKNYLEMRLGYAPADII